MLGYKFTTEQEANQSLIDCALFYQSDNLGFAAIPYYADKDIPTFWYIEFRAYLWAILGAPEEFSITE